MPDNILEIAGAVLAALLGGGGVAAIITAKAGAQRADIDALSFSLREVREESARLYCRVEILEKANSELQTQVQTLRAENAELRLEVARLRSENAELRNCK